MHLSVSFSLKIDVWRTDLDIKSKFHTRLKRDGQHV